MHVNFGEPSRANADRVGINFLSLPIETRPVRQNRTSVCYFTTNNDCAYARISRNIVINSLHAVVEYYR